MRYLITFSYDGSNFKGYQKQKKHRTVQEELEKVLTRINDKKVVIYSSGRTDNKVHAINQKAHFDFNKIIELKKFKKAINSYLPKDIYIKQIEKVNDDFHARYNFKKKQYLYIINTGEFNIFEQNYVYQYNQKLNIRKIKKAIKLFIGEHDFKAFKSFDNKKEYNIRTIYKANIKYKNKKIYIRFMANGFLMHQVRNMVGTLIEIGSNQKDISIIKEMLNTKNKELSSWVVNPEGLYLENVI